MILSSLRYDGFGLARQFSILHLTGIWRHFSNERGANLFGSEKRPSLHLRNAVCFFECYVKTSPVRRRGRGSWGHENACYVFLMGRIFENISDTELVIELRELARKERVTNSMIVARLAEVGRRRLYLALGYSSLYELRKSRARSRRNRWACGQWPVAGWS